MARIVTATFTFTVDDEATDDQVESVLADAFVQIDEAVLRDEDGEETGYLPTGIVHMTWSVSKPGFPVDVEPS